MHFALGSAHFPRVRSDRQTSCPPGRVPHRRRAARPRVVERLEERTLLSRGSAPRAVHDFGARLAAAQVIALDAAGAATREGHIEVAGNIDVFRFVAPATGGYLVRQEAAPGSDLDSLLTVFNAAGVKLAVNDESGLGSGGDSAVRLKVVAGRTYYVQAGAYEASTGGYRLTLSAVPEPGGNFATALPVVLSPPTAVDQVEGIETVGDVDVFRLVVSLTGYMTIRPHPDDESGLSIDLAVFDDSRRRIADQDVTHNGESSPVRFAVEAGRTYFVRARASTRRLPAFNPAGASRGSYTLSFVPDDFSGTFSRAQDLALDAAGAGRQEGFIGTRSDVDAFRFVAPVTGLLEVRLDAGPGSDLNGFLDTYDAAGGELAYDDDSGPGRNRLVRFKVVTGRTYFVRASGIDDGTSDPTGWYTLSLRTGPPVVDDVGDSLAEAQTVTPDAAGSATREGQIEAAGDVDVFRFVAPVTAPFMIRQEAAPGSDLLGLLTVFDATGGALAGDTGSGLGNVVRLDIVAGRTYFIQAAGYPSTGRYRLTLFAVPEVGDDFASALAVALPPTVAIDQVAGIEAVGDVDFFRFESPLTGRVTVQQHPDDESGLSADLAVFDDSQRLITDNDSAPSAYSWVHFAVEAGRTYFVRARASTRRLPAFNPAGARTGGYTLSFVPDDFGSTSAEAQDLTLDAVGAGRQEGITEGPSDIDVFRLVAPISGVLEVRLDVSPGSVGDLTVYDAEEAVLASGAGTTGPSRLARFPVAAGRTYFVWARANSYRPSSIPNSRYTLTLGVDDFGDTPAEAQALAPDAIGAATREGRIEAAGDVDVFRFVAPLTGRITARLVAAPGSVLDGSLAVIDRTGRLIARAGAGGPQLGSEVQWGVTAGQPYYIQATATGASIGGYILTLAGSDAPFVVVPEITLSPSGSGSQAGEVEMTGDGDVFRFIAPVSGQMTVRQVAAPDSALEAVLAVFDDSRRPLADNEGGGGGRDSLVRFPVEAGRAYFVRAAGAGASTGRYSLDFSVGHPVDDDAGNTLQEPTDFIFSDNGFFYRARRVGTIEVPGDVDVFQFTVPRDGEPSSSSVLTIRQEPGLASTQKASLSLYSQSGEFLTSDDDPAGATASSSGFFGADDSGTRLVSTVIPGRSYFVRVAGVRASVGEYTLTVILVTVSTGPGPPTPPSLPEDPFDIDDATPLAPLPPAAARPAFAARPVAVRPAFAARPTFIARPAAVRPAASRPAAARPAATPSVAATESARPMGMATAVLIVAPASNGTDPMIPLAGGGTALTSFAIGLDQSFLRARPTDATTGVRSPGSHPVLDEREPDFEHPIAILPSWMADLGAALRAFGRKYLRGCGLDWMHPIDRWLRAGVSPMRAIADFLRPLFQGPGGPTMPARAGTTGAMIPEAIDVDEGRPARDEDGADARPLARPAPGADATAPWAIALFVPGAWKALQGDRRAAIESTRHRSRASPSRDRSGGCRRQGRSGPSGVDFRPRASALGNPRIWYPTSIGAARPSGPVVSPPGRVHQDDEGTTTTRIGSAKSCPICSSRRGSGWLSWITMR
jgi:hypothetical protein